MRKHQRTVNRFTLQADIANRLRLLPVDKLVEIYNTLTSDTTAVVNPDGMRVDIIQWTRQ